MLPSPSAAMKATVVIDDFPPWKIVEGNQVSGIDIELTKALFDEVGLTPEFIVCPWTRCLAMLRSGKGDFISGLLKRPEREKHISYIEPPYKTQSTKAFYRLTWADEINTFDDLKGLAIGTQRGARYYPEFDCAEHLTKRPVENDRLNFLKLNAGRVDTVIATESQGDYMISHLKLRGKVTKAALRHSEINPVYFAVSKRSPLHSMVPQLKAATQRLRDNGTFDMIIKEYFQNLNKEL